MIKIIGVIVGMFFLSQVISVATSDTMVLSVCILIAGLMAGGND